MRAVRIFLLILIIVGLGLIATQSLWVPTLVNKILAYQRSAPQTTAAETNVRSIKLQSSGNILNLKLGESVRTTDALEGKAVFTIKLESIANGKINLVVTGPDKNTTATQKETIAQGEIGTFFNFYPLGLQIIPTSITSESTTLSIEIKATD